MVNRFGIINLENKNYPFLYTNFGIAIVVLILESIYNKDNTQLMNDYIKNDLVLNNTKISDGNGNLSNYWLWEEVNTYILAGVIKSIITDMMMYAKKQIKDTPPNINLSHNVINWVNATPSNFAELGIHINAVGACWMIDTVNNIIWHNGGTGNYNSYLDFDKKKRVAVIMMSNMAAD